MQTLGNMHDPPFLHLGLQIAERKKYQQHKLIRRMMQEINCIFHKRQPLNLTKILFIGDESQKTVTKIFRDYFFLRESTVFYLDDGIFHSKNDVKDNKKTTKCTLPF